MIDINYTQITSCPSKDRLIFIKYCSCGTGGSGGGSRGADLASSAHYRSRSASARRAAPSSTINAPPLAPLLVQGCLLPSSAQTLFRSRFRPSMSDKTKEPFYSQGPPPKIGKWEGFKVFLWNGETGQFLGRTAGSWGESFKSSLLIAVYIRQIVIQMI